MMQMKAELLRKVSEFFSNVELPLEGKKLCVGLSGGADSVALLRSTMEVADSFGFVVCACHFNHLIRGEEADRDEWFCRKLCSELGVNIYCGRDDVPAYSKHFKVSLEEGARECRYAFFHRIMDFYKLDYCLTAHNMNDNAETLLYNIIRGTGINGASAISPVLNDKILRPFLNVKRNEIEAFLSEINQNYVNDSTNDSIEYTRNRIRKVILPEIEKINPSAVDSISRFIESCRNDREYFEKILPQYYGVDLRCLHNSLKQRVILSKYKDFSGKMLNNASVHEITKALDSGVRAVISVNTQDEAVICEGRIDFYKISDRKIFDETEIDLKGTNLIFNENVSLDFLGEDLQISENVNKISITELISFDNIVGTVKARSRRIGDKIQIRGINRSLKKLFIEMKIPKEYRDLVPILFDDAGIIYVPFVGISDRAFPKVKSNNVYVKTSLNKIDRERWTNAYEK